MHALVLALGLMTVYGKACSEPVDMLFDWTYGGNHPGASVAVIKDGSIIWERSYGMANVETGEKATVNTNYRLASMTKQFTAMAILLCEEQKLLSLDDKVTKYLPELGFASKITLRNLLVHTGGLPEYDPMIPKDRTDQVLDKDVPGLLLKQPKLDVKTGRFSYSNTGYVLLALVVEKVSKMSFGKYLERNIFKPLGMTNSLAYEAKTPIKNRAFGYQVNADNDKYTRADQDKATAVLGDGGIYSSVTDIAKWVDALEKGTLIKGKRFAEATSTQVKTNDPAVGYGYGFRIGQEQGEKVVWHTGTTSGFKNALLWVPSRKLAIVVLTNRKQSDSLRLAWRVLEHFWDR